MDKNMNKINIIAIYIILSCFSINLAYAQTGSLKGKKKDVNLPKIQQVDTDSLMKAMKPGKNLPAKKKEKEAKVYTRSADLKLEALSRGDSVILRWAVSTPGGWITANNAGYVIERYLVDSVADFEFFELTPKPLKPWTLDEWKQRSERTDKFAAIAAQCLYGKKAIKEIEKENGTTEDYTTNLRYAAIELSNRHGFASFVADIDAHAATGLALRYVDKNTKPNATYMYKVRVSYQDTTYFIQEAVTIVKVGDNRVVSISPSGFKALAKDKQVTLIWSNPEKEAYTAYNLYRSDDDGKTFKKINKSPILPMDPDYLQGKTKPDNSDIPGSFIDSNLTNNKTYVYRLNGINMFAEEGDGSVIKATPKETKLPPAPVIIVDHIGLNKARIRWDYPKNEKGIVGFGVSKTSDFTNIGGYLHKKPLDINVREFIDTTANENEPYYIVSVMDTLGNMSHSIPRLLIMNDTVPPSKPTGLGGSIDSKGIVNLYWDLCPESNVIGYQVFWANDSTHTFLMVNKSIIEDTTYKDSVDIHTLSKHVYYKLAAINKRYIVSQKSDMLVLNRPDIIPPQNAVFTKFAVTDTSINLEWVPSTSEDAVIQTVLRRLSGEENWSKLADIPMNVGSYIDKNITANSDYEYAIRTTDDSKLNSVTENLIHAKALRNGIVFGIKDLKAVYDETKGIVNLSWEFDESMMNGKYWFSIYRSYSKSSPDNNLQMVESLGSDLRLFVDKLLYGKGFYNYSVQVVSNNGQSGLSRNVSIEIK
jgi:hypothetical protein